MKKITVNLGAPHNEFERQIKDTLNYIVDSIELLSKEQKIIIECQNKNFLKDSMEAQQSSTCDICDQQADILTINIKDGSYKSYCNNCLLKK